MTNTCKNITLATTSLRPVKTRMALVILVDGERETEPE